jgi:hypothetical protein
VRASKNVEQGSYKPVVVLLGRLRDAHSAWRGWHHTVNRILGDICHALVLIGEWQDVAKLSHQPGYVAIRLLTRMIFIGRAFDVAFFELPADVLEFREPFLRRNPKFPPDVATERMRPAYPKPP